MSKKKECPYCRDFDCPMKSGPSVLEMMLGDGDEEEQ